MKEEEEERRGGFYQEAAPPPPPPASSSSNPDASLNIVIATKVSSLFREPCSALHQNRNSCLPLAERRPRYEAFKGDGCSVHTRRQTGQVTNIPVPLSAAGRAFMMGKSRPRSDEKPSTGRCAAKPRWLERPLTGPLCF